MRGRNSIRNSRQLLVAVCAASVGLSSVAFADQLQNAAARADSALLGANGFGSFGSFGPLNGELVTVGVVEAGGGIANAAGPNINTSPGSRLPNGNADLPFASVKLFQLAGNVLPAGGALPAGLVVSNHGTAVTGVVVGRGVTAADDIGIAAGAVVQEAGLTGAADAPNGLIDLTQRAITNGATIANYSLGIAVAANNGSNIRSTFLDWAAGRYNLLSAVAGNEDSTEVDAPADAFNILCVGATASRTNYHQADSFLNVSSTGVLNANATSDGRIGVSLVAPGGDTGPGARNAGTFANLPAFDNQFHSTAGGQFELNGTDGAGNAIYFQDSFDGGASTAAYGRAVDDAAPGVGAPFPNRNPGANLGAGDSVAGRTLAGTSFATPLVSGAGAVVTQYGLLGVATNVKSNIGNFPFNRNATDPTDHRVLKAILMNGAQKTNVDGSKLTRSSGVAWIRSLNIQGPKALPAPLAANAVGPVSVSAQSGLDTQLGSGQLSLLDSLKNYAAGEQGPGAPGAANVQPIGWDYENVPANSAANTLYTYNFNLPGGASYFQGTLCWDAPVTITNAGAGNSFQVSGGANPVSTLARNALTDFDLYFFRVNPNNTLVELGSSTSNVDNVEHIFYDGSDGSLGVGNYQIDVVAPGGVGATAVPYGLAWLVPEPMSLAWITMCVPLLRRRRS